MKCVILAAGYATRLYPLTQNFPKPLLEVAGKPILDWLIDDMSQTGLIDEYIIISNHKFAPIFEQWAEKKKEFSIFNFPFSILDDSTSSNETRLGAVKDIQFAIDQLHLDDDLLVMAGDNLLDFSLSHFIRFAKEKNATCGSTRPVWPRSMPTVASSPWRRSPPTPRATGASPPSTTTPVKTPDSSRKASRAAVA